ncbi:MAG: glycosyltransferase family 2 protein [Bacteroidales bacterium]|nr:glycosyltransferase family 2 protein [Bacteroidales bacterium]
MPLLSIIVPVYRVEAYLDRCVESIIAQALDDWELILVDDGSPDRCPAMCDAWAQRDPHIRVIHKPNGGLSSARNAGLDTARGEYITFVDSDDALAPDTLRPNLDYLLRHAETDLVQYPTLWQAGSQTERSDTAEPCLLQGREAIFNAWYDNHPLNNSAGNKIYRTRHLADLRYPEGRLYEDKFFMFSLLPRLQQVMLSDRGLYCYYENETSILHTPSLQRRRDWMDSEVLMLQRMAPQPELKKQLSARYMRTLRYLMVTQHQYTDANLQPQLEALQYLLPNISITGPVKDRFWLLLLHLVGTRGYAQIYLHLLKRA